MSIHLLSPTRRSKTTTAIGVAGAFCLAALFFYGYRGRQESLASAGIEELVHLRKLLLEKLEERTRALVTTENSPPGLAQEIQSQLRILRQAHREFDSRYTQVRISPRAVSQLQLSRATISNADGLFSDTLQELGAETALSLDLRENRDMPSLAPIRLLLRADAYYGLSQWTDALTNYSQLLIAKPNHVAALAQIAKCQRWLGGNSNAIQTYEALARAYRDQGDKELSRAKPGVADSYYSDQAKVLTWLSSQHTSLALNRELGFAHQRRGNLLLAQNKPGQAIPEFEKADEVFTELKKQEQYPTANMDLAISQAAKADALLYLRNPREAEQHYATSIGLTEQITKSMADKVLVATLAKNLSNRGSAALARQGIDEALRDFDQAIAYYSSQTEPDSSLPEILDSALTYGNRGVARRAKGDTEPAVRDFDHAVALLSRPSTPQPHLPIRTEDPGLSSFSVAVRLDVAITFTEKNLEVFTRTRLPNQSTSTAIEVALALCYKNRAYTYLSMGRFSEVQRDLTQTAGIYEKLVEEQDEEDLSTEYIKTLTSSALLFAAHPSAQLRDAATARKYAIKACELTNYQAAPQLQALAAAHAECGDFKEAAKWQEICLNIVNPKLKPEFEARLNLYRAGQPFRIPPSPLP